jgi:hypothetical protein
MLEALLSPEGLPRGYRAQHFRVQRFLDALRRVGYIVEERPLGPRGGMRWVLESYGGARQGLLFRLGAGGWCFACCVRPCTQLNGLSDDDLVRLERWTKWIEKDCGVILGAHFLATVVSSFDDETLSIAVKLYVGRSGETCLRALCEAIGAAASA